MPKTPLKLVALLASSLGLAPLARASTPVLQQVVPRGAQRGTEIDVVFKGNRLADAKEVLLYDGDLSVTSLEATGPQEVKVHLKVSPNAKLGEHVMRLRTASGISELRNFYVGPFPVVAERAEPGLARRGIDPAKLPADKRPTSFEDPQKIDFNVTVTGVIEAEQADYFLVECKKGQRLTAEVEGIRLGETFDPFISILDPSRFEVASSDDTALLRQDCFVSILAPKDGPYVIQVRESSYGGSPTSYYRLHVGTFPRPTAIYPPGGKAGDEVDIKFIGDPSGPIAKHIKVPETPGEQVGLYAEQDGLTTPSANAFRVSAFPNVLEVEPNDEFGKATAASGDLPVAFNGVIDKEGDVDFFKFKAAKGQVLDVRVFARQLRSPLDSVMAIHDAKGNKVAENDDSGGPDSYLRFTAPADGEFGVSIKDHLNRGGADYVYRIEVTPVEARLTLSIPNFGQAGQPSQERQTIVVPKGNRYGTLIRATRADVGGDVTLSAADLPPGLTMYAEPAAPGQDVIPVIFEAAADATVSGKLTDLTATTSDEKAGVKGQFVQQIDLATSPQNNNQPLYSVQVKKVAVAVADAVPFSLTLVQPKVPIVQGGSMDLKVLVERKGDFKGPVNVKMLWDPPGVSSGVTTIPPDKTEIAMPLNAAPNAAAKAYKIAVTGDGDVGGPAWVSTALTPMEVAPGFVGLQIVKTNIEQGKAGEVVARIDPKTPFPGKAKVELIGLPNGVTAAPAEIGSDDKEVKFAVTTDAKSPAGLHTTLMCRVTVTRDGEPMVQTVGQGGVLRIDPAGGAKTPLAGAKK